MEGQSEFNSDCSLTKGGETVLKNDSTDIHGVRTGHFRHGGETCDFIYAPSHSAMIRAIEDGEAASECYTMGNGSSWAGRTVSAKQIKKEGLEGEGYRADSKAVAKHESSMMDALSQYQSEIVANVRYWTDSPKSVNAISIDRLIRGEAGFKSKRRMRVKDEVIALFVPTNALGDIDSDIVQIRSSAALAAAEILEENGYMVEIYGLAYSSRVGNDGSSACAVTRIKAADEVFNLGQAASAMSAWVWRTVTFTARSLAAGRARGYSSDGIGSSRSPNRDFCDKLATMLGCDRFTAVNLIPRNNNAESQIKKAVDAVITALEEVLTDDSC